MEFLMLKFEGLVRCGFFMLKSEPMSDSNFFQVTSQLNLLGQSKRTIRGVKQERTRFKERDVLRHFSEFKKIC